MSGWTPAQKRQYAIRKTKERQRAERSERLAPQDPGAPQAPEPGYEHHPDNHRCSPWDVEYGDLRSRCTRCGRLWVVTEHRKKEGGTWRETVTIPTTRVMPPAA